MELKDERPVVVGIGEVVMDCYENGTSKLGGAPLIFAYHAAKTRCKGVIISAVGNEDDNSIKNQVNDNNIKNQVINKGVIPVFNTVGDKPSGTVEVKGDLDKPEYDINTNAAWTEIKSTEENEKCLNDLSKEAKAVYFGTLASSCGGSSKDMIDKFIEDVSNGKTTQNIIKDGFLDQHNNVLLKIFDVNLRQDNKDKEHITTEQTSVINDYIKKCNVLKINKKELKLLHKNAQITETDDDKAGEMLMEQFGNVQILILTKREEGSTIFWRDSNMEGIFCQSIRIRLKPKHTVGAGDAMVGTFVGELLNGESIQIAYTKAVQRANLVCNDEKKNSMPEFNGKDFFFSFSKNDNVVVDLFYNKFTENKKYTVFKFNQDILPGEKSGISIPDAINNCHVFVFFSSSEANESDNVITEINIAKENHKNIIIVKLDDSHYPESLKDLEPIQYEIFELYQKLHDENYSVFQQLDDIYKKIIEYYNKCNRG